MTIAALYVERGGSYFGLDCVDPWDEQRDARLYAGPHPVVAHPPCARWCRLAGLVEARWGHKRGDDGGCFASALAAVRKWGGGAGASGAQRRLAHVRATGATAPRRMGARHLWRLGVQRRAGALRPPCQEVDLALRLRSDVAASSALGIRRRPRRQGVGDLVRESYASQPSQSYRPDIGPRSRQGRPPTSRREASRQSHTAGV